MTLLADLMIFSPSFQHFCTIVHIFSPFFPTFFSLFSELSVFALPGRAQESRGKTWMWRPWRRRPPEEMGAPWEVAETPWILMDPLCVVNMAGPHQYSDIF